MVDDPDATTDDMSGPKVGPEYDDDVEAPTPSHLPKSLADPVGREFVAALSLVFVRHGVTDLTTRHILSGSGDPGPPLNAAGRIQAAKAADAVYRVGRQTWDRVAPVTRIIASPMVRTQQTAAALGRRIGAHVDVDERVREVNFGEWEGLTAEEAAHRDGDLIHRWQQGDTPAPGGESINDVTARLGDFIAALAADHARACATDDAPRSVAVASHAVAIKAAVAAALGFPSQAAARIWPVPASVTIMQLRVTESGHVAEGHLLGLGVPTD